MKNSIKDLRKELKMQPKKVPNFNSKPNKEESISREVRDIDLNVRFIGEGKLQAEEERNDGEPSS